MLWALPGGELEEFPGDARRHGKGYRCFNNRVQDEYRANKFLKFLFFFSAVAGRRQKQRQKFMQHIRCLRSVIINCFTLIGYNLSCRVALLWNQFRRFMPGCTIVNWPGDRDEVHFEPPKLAVRNLDPRSSAIVDKCSLKIRQQIELRSIIRNVICRGSNQDMPFGSRRADLKIPKAHLAVVCTGKCSWRLKQEADAANSATKFKAGLQLIEHTHSTCDSTDHTRISNLKATIKKVHAQKRRTFTENSREMKGNDARAGMTGRGKRQIPEKTRRPMASSGTISTCKNSELPALVGGERANSLATAAPSNAKRLLNVGLACLVGYKRASGLVDVLHVIEGVVDASEKTIFVSHCPCLHAKDESFKRGSVSMSSCSMPSPVPFTTFGVVCTPASRSLAPLPALTLVSLLRLLRFPTWRTCIVQRTAVAERSACSAPTKSEPGSYFPGRNTSGFSQVGIVPDDAVGRRVFPGISHFPALSFWRRSILTSLTLIGSRDLTVKSRPNLFTHILQSINEQKAKANRKKGQQEDENENTTQGNKTVKEQYQWTSTTEQ
ncbi:hypothetical protein PR048_002895 [Dryococelus australis]|uniref:Uncharacterized protein n=1 Tax=Dryococelus australis TaxID=614101 RepID=A0ABQ9IMJ1_9NEOP|nr:hypothetical protein PR048_002895 [Dryococelus australis]